MHSFKEPKTVFIVSIASKNSIAAIQAIPSLQAERPWGDVFYFLISILKVVPLPTSELLTHILPL